MNSVTGRPVRLLFYPLWDFRGFRALTDPETEAYYTGGSTPGTRSWPKKGEGNSSTARRWAFPSPWARGAFGRREAASGRAFSGRPEAGEAPPAHLGHPEDQDYRATPRGGSPGPEAPPGGEVFRPDLGVHLLPPPPQGHQSVADEAPSPVLRAHKGPVGPGQGLREEAPGEVGRGWGARRAEEEVARVPPLHPEDHPGVAEGQVALEGSGPGDRPGRRPRPPREARGVGPSPAAPPLRRAPRRGGPPPSRR